MGNVAQRHFFSMSWSADPALRRVYVYPFQECEYKIHRFEEDGSELPPLELDLEPVPMTEEELQAEMDFIKYRLTQLEGGDPVYNVEVNDPWTYRAPVMELHVDSASRLWARRGTEDEPFFDIWSPEGELLGHAVLPGPGPKSLSWRFEIGEGGMLAYDKDPALVQKVYLVSVVSDGGML
jgi:hypothetical protein